MPALPAELRTPAYVLDIAALERNLDCLAGIKEATGTRILLASKAFSVYPLFPRMARVLDGTTASGLFEARLGREHFGREVHVYAPAYTDEEMEALLGVADHICFNSSAQVARYLAPARARGKKVGVRINPDFSQVKTPRYNPCSPLSRFGVPPTELDALPWDKLDFIHVHALSDNLAEESIRLVGHMAARFAPYIRRVGEVNFGGGHYLTHPAYDRDGFVAALCAFRREFGVATVLEPGGAVVLNAGCLVARVLDITSNPHGTQVAVLDTSATCHMIDVLDMPYRPDVRGAGQPGEKPHTYLLGGKTCMSGDVLGSFSFDAPLQPGDRIVFEDMLQYNLVKSTFFNGVPLPDMVCLYPDGRTDVIGHYGYEDYRARLYGNVWPAAVASRAA